LTKIEEALIGKKIINFRDYGDRITITFTDGTELLILLNEDDNYQSWLLKYE